MADENANGKKPVEPPKIKLPLSGNGNGKANGNGKKTETRMYHTVPPSGAVPPKVIVEEAAKSQTSRIDLSQTQPPAAASNGIKKATARIVTGEPAAAEIKKATGRIAGAQPPATQEAKKETAKVEVGEPSTFVTAPASSAPDHPKKQTARIDLAEVMQGGAGPAAPAAAAPSPPKTIRIKMPSTVVPPTTILRKPPEPATVALPGAGPIEAKSETARIELPPDAVAEPTTQRKTIRIKRAGAGMTTMAGKPLVVARTPSISTEPSEETVAAVTPVEPEAGTLYAVIALAAVLVVCVLVYALAAQVGTLDTLLPPHVPFFRL